MKTILVAAALCAVSLPALAAPACGLKGAPIPVGSLVQELTISGRDSPTMGFGGARATHPSIVARPCHGTLTILHPPEFRYVPTPGFVGRDMYAFRACLANGRCDVIVAVVTVNP